MTVFVDKMFNRNNVFLSNIRATMYKGGSRGEQGVRTPLKNHKNIGFLSKTGPDSLKITKLPSQHSMLGQHRRVSETPFKWRFGGGPMMGRLWWHLDPSSPHQLKKQQQKNVVKVWPPLAKLSGSAHDV